MNTANLNRNYYFAFGIFFGFLLCYYVPFENEKDVVVKDCPEATVEYMADKYGNDFDPQLNLEQKPMIAKKPVKNIIRPRYYSSELGIREKLFVGVMSSQENIPSLATAFNKTAAHLVDKIKFFINADNVKSNFKLKNIVGFTDTREHLRPFLILKYIGDNYLDDYDYFFLVTDSGYLNARLLIEKLNHISISLDIYLGQRLENEQNFCDFDAGILLSSSVIKKIRDNLDWCVRNSASNKHSYNIGKCVEYSTKDINECQSTSQGINITSYQLNSYKIYRDLQSLKNEPNFNNAVTVYPITTTDDFYLLHAYFSRVRLETIKKQIDEIDAVAQQISNGTIPNDILEVRWPLGVQNSKPAEARHDIITWTYFNLTHSFMFDAENNVKPLSKIEIEDIEKILQKTLNKAKSLYPHLLYHKMHTAYKKFDPVRGMDYRLFIEFTNVNTKELVSKSFEVVKPLGLIEIVTSPYVTESTRIAMLLPTFEHQVKEAIEFVNRYEASCMENHDNTFLMLVLLYKVDSPSKGDHDVFVPLKSLAVDLTDKYKADGSRIAWVSIRLPAEYSEAFHENDILINSVYGRNEILSLAVTDLALRKIGLDSLVMLCSNSMTFKMDFLNRIRMNTIQGFQIFSPIGFMMYPCKWTTLCKDCDTCDVGQNSGYFDRNNYDVISFYSRDYVEARKKLESEVPIVRSDRDIANLANKSEHHVNKLIDIFVRSQYSVHVLRAVEPNLRFGQAVQSYLLKYDKIPKCPYSNSTTTVYAETNLIDKCIKLGSRKQIGESILPYEKELDF